MSGGFTGGIEEQILSIACKDSSEIWGQIDNVPKSQNVAYWAAMLKRIADDYSTVSRFALIRILCARAKRKADFKQELSDDVESFTDEIKGKRYCFSDISKTHSDNFSAEEHLEYLEYINALAQSINENLSDSEKENDRELILRAWFDVDSANSVAIAQLPENIRSKLKKLAGAKREIEAENKKKYKTLLTKDEVLKLGHILRFNLEEIQWYMLRVLDYEGGFRYNRSNDLIEIYGFAAGRDWRDVEKLKKRYYEESKGTKKIEEYVDERPLTADASDDLLSIVSQQRTVEDKELMDNAFLSWLLSRAAYLDTISYKSTFIYRSIAVMAYEHLIGETEIPDEETFMDYLADIRSVYENEDHVIERLYLSGKIDYECCKKVADRLLLDNKIQSASIQADNAKAWHVLSTLADGTPTVSGGIVNTGRDRIAKILEGKIQVEKGDMLYLFWFIVNLIWQSNDESDCPEERIKLFMGMASDLLKDSLLPDFYLPHLMEQSMLLSIAYGARQGDDSSVVYEYMLQSLVKTRNRQKK